MKLILETIEDVKYVTEAREDGKKDLFIEGVFLQGNIKNRNGRMYPINVLDKEVNRYINENIKNNRAYGELNHPSGPTINLDRVSHRIVSLNKEGSNYVGKAKILDTPMGNIARSLINEGCNLGVSSRGLGTLKPKDGIMEVQSDFRLATAADLVSDPSAPDAYVRGVMENVEWVYDESTNGYRAVEVAFEQKKQIKKERIDENKAIRLFEQFLNSLKTK